MKLIEDTQIGINGVALLSPLTGIGQYTFHLVRELQKLLRVKPWLFYGVGWRQEVRMTPLPGSGRVKDLIKYLVPNAYVVSRFLQQRKFSFGAQEHRIELYHEPNFLAYRFRGPTVVTVHDLSWIRHAEAHPKERVNIMNRIMPQVLKHTEHVLVDSDFVRREVIDYYGLSPSQITTVLLGVSPEFHPVSEDRCRDTLARHGLNYGGYLLAVGTLEPRKNLATAIAAYAQLPDAVRSRIPLVIVGMNGWGMDKFSPAVKRMIGRGEIRLTGYISQRELPALYSGARMFVYPSIYEGFGLPPLEAMACGIPVVVSNRASLPEVVGTAGILVEPMDDAAIMQHMRALVDDDVLHRKLSEAGLKQAQSFTWSRCANETLAVYQKVMAAA